MADLEQTGRTGAPSDDKFQDTIARKSAEQAMLLKLDEINESLKAMAAKLDADAGVTDTDYASSITDALDKIKLKP